MTVRLLTKPGLAAPWITLTRGVRVLDHEEDDVELDQNRAEGAGEEGGVSDQSGEEGDRPEDCGGPTGGDVEDRGERRGRGA
ncbi:hypothetical protein [Nocardioides sp.]|jgi:hypothetical protein|uniref:hypothetical protein n=1 Tax=Nocardioides sp. TaxID=35761 RepID=UPI0039C91C87